MPSWRLVGRDGHRRLRSLDGKVWKLVSFNTDSDPYVIPQHLRNISLITLFCSNYNMRGRAEEILVEGGSIRKVAKKEEYSDVMARFRIKDEDEEDTPEEGENQEEESDTE